MVENPAPEGRSRMVSKKSAGYCAPNPLSQNATTVAELYRRFSLREGKAGHARQNVCIATKDGILYGKEGRKEGRKEGP